MKDWISIKDKVPDTVSVQYIGLNTLEIKSYRVGARQYVVVDANMLDYRATYWMPLQPPRQETP